MKYYLNDGIKFYLGDVGDSGRILCIDYVEYNWYKSEIGESKIEIRFCCLKIDLIKFR